MEVEKTKQLEDMITIMTRRINGVLEELAQDNSFTDNSEQLRNFIEALDYQNQTSFSSEYLEQDGDSSLNISQEWMKNIDILEGVIKSFKAKCLGYKQENRNLALKVEDLTHKVDECMKTIQGLNQKLKDNDELRLIKAELKEERKQREKLRGLLDRTEYEKNEFMNKINNIGLKEAEIKAKTKE